MPPKKKTPLTSNQKKAIKDARKVMARASAEIRRILSNADSEDFITAECRTFPRGHCREYLHTAGPGGGSEVCRRRTCRHSILDHLPRLPD
jgi:hypothetical protein